MINKNFQSKMTNQNFQSIGIKADGTTSIFKNLETGDIYEFVYLSIFDDQPAIFCRNGYLTSEMNLYNSGKLTLIKKGAN